MDLRVCAYGCLCGIIQYHDELVAAILENGLRQAVLGHFPADRRNAGAAVFSAEEGLGHDRQGRIALVRACDAQLFHGHLISQTNG